LFLENILQPVCESIRKSVFVFASGSEQSDDLTLLALHFKGKVSS